MALSAAIRVLISVASSCPVLAMSRTLLSRRSDDRRRLGDSVIVAVEYDRRWPRVWPPPCPFFLPRIPRSFNRLTRLLHDTWYTSSKTGGHAAQRRFEVARETGFQAARTRFLTNPSRNRRNGLHKPCSRPRSFNAGATGFLPSLMTEPGCAPGNRVSRGVRAPRCPKRICTPLKPGSVDNPVP